MKLLNFFGIGGGQQHPTPLAWRTEDGVFVGHNGEAWLYRMLPRYSLAWEDKGVRQLVAQQLRNLLIELGRLSRGGPMPGMSIGAEFREFHLLNLSWRLRCPTPPSTPPALIEWLDPMFDDFSISDSAFVVGVKLRRSRPPHLRGIKEIVKILIEEARGGPPDIRMIAADRSVIGGILQRAGGAIPTAEDTMRIESWWNGAKGPNGVITSEADGRSISCDAWPNGLEFAALVGFDKAQMDPERGLWLLDAFAHKNGCVAASIRGELHPPKVVRDAFRKIRRKAIGRIQDQAATGDLEREEDQDLLDTAEILESVFIAGDEPLVRNASLLFARRAALVTATYADHMRSQWGLEIKPIEYRQVEALDEMMPCSTVRFGKNKPFVQDFTLGVLSESGIGSYSAVGDSKGVWIGVAPPDMSGVWLDPVGAAEADKPPALAVVGEPGAGKTFLLQLIATQAAIMNLPVVYINPKPADSLDGFAAACGGETIKISSLTEGSSRGMLDPFRYTSPENAAEIAIAHISCVLTDMDEQDEVLLGAGIYQAAMEGAQCVGDALKHPRISPDIRDLVQAQCQASSLFHLGISFEPHARLGAGGNKGLAQERGLTLIEFDRPIPLPPTAAPTRTYERPTRAAVAAVRLVCRAALEQMFQFGGGVLIVDEAHVFLGSEEGRAIIQRLGREGRSQRILPILATQRIADVISEGVDMGSYLGRVLVMKMTDEREANAALELCGLEPNAERRAWLAEAGPRRGERGALSLYRDLHGRCSAVMHGPITPEIAELFSTNPLDRAPKAE